MPVLGEWKEKKNTLWRLRMAGDDEGVVGLCRT